MIIVAIATWLLFLGATHLHAQGQFYEGKTIRIVVGLPAGDAYDLYARMLAAHMSKYIPGNPAFIVQNMPGASSMITANHVYAIGKPDGLTFGSVLPSLYFDQLLGRKEVQFDWPKFTWLGSFERSNNLLYMRSDTPYKNIHQVTKSSDPIKCGSTGTGSPSYYLVKLLDDAIGTKFDIVTGYKRRPGYRPGGRKGRNSLSRFYRHDLLRPGAFSHVAQNRIRPRAYSNRQPA